MEVVSAVRRGRPYREVARRHKISLGTVAAWVKRAAGQALNEVDWADRSHRRRGCAGGTPVEVVRAILRWRRHLKDRDALGEYGPEAIRRHLVAEGLVAPCARTIARWLKRKGCSGVERWRRNPPPKGWYLPAVAQGKAELDGVDVVEGLRLRSQGRVEVLNLLAVWDGLCESHPAKHIHTPDVREMLERHWRQHGLPRYLQMDNDTIFSGAHAQRDYFGRLVHWCLCVGVIPVFTPPATLGFQAGIEAYNRRWQEKVWRRWRHPSLVRLRERSAAFVSAYNQRQTLRREGQRSIRRSWRPPASDPQALPVILLRKLDESGALQLCAQRWRISSAWAGRLVRCEIDVPAQRLSIYALRRADSAHQPLIAQRRIKTRLVPWNDAPSA